MSMNRTIGRIADTAADWMLAMQSLEVSEADIAKFAVLYATNARTTKPANRRLILSSL